MKIVSTEELIDHKILPYNIYSEFGEKIFAAGETLTPGKLLQLKHISVLYRDEEPKASPSVPQKEVAQVSLSSKITSSDFSSQNENTNNFPSMIETFDMRPSTILRNKLSVDDIDVSGYRGTINKKSQMDPQTQLKIKAFYLNILKVMSTKPPLEMLGLFANIRDKIVQDIILSSDGGMMLSSQLKLLGEYKRCHALNTAILSGMLAKKMNLSENRIYDVVLAGLLHDIGKEKIPEELSSKTNLTNQELLKLQEHTKIGYKIIKVEMELSDNIARAALEHHEHNDGSGYPYGRSGDRITVESQIVNVCNYFDNLTSNRTPYPIRNTKEALRVLLRLGTNRFSAESLYTFIHMFSYNDTTTFEDMVM